MTSSQSSSSEELSFAVAVFRWFHIGTVVVFDFNHWKLQGPYLFWARSNLFFFIFLWNEVPTVSPTSLRATSSKFSSTPDAPFVMELFTRLERRSEYQRVLIATRTRTSQDIVWYNRPQREENHMLQDHWYAIVRWVYVSIMMYELFIISIRVVNEILSCIFSKKKRQATLSFKHFCPSSLIHLVIFVRSTIYDTTNNALLLTFYFQCSHYQFLKTFSFIWTSSIIDPIQIINYEKNKFNNFVLSKFDIRSTSAERGISMTRR